MTDTPRTRTNLATIFSNNNTQAITAQDIRDLLASVPLSTEPTEYSAPAAPPTQLTITKTGDWCYPQAWSIVSTANYLDENGNVSLIQSKGTDNLLYQEPVPNATTPSYYKNILTLSFDDLAFVTGGINFTLPLATSLAFPELLFVRSTITLSSNTLTTISFPKMKNSGTITLTAIPAVTNITFPELINSSSISITSTGCTTFSCPLLTRSGAIAITAANLDTLNISAIQLLNGAFSISTNAVLTEIDLDNLEYLNGNFSPSNLSSVTSLKLSKLKHVVGNFSPTSFTNAGFTSLSCPELIDVTATVGFIGMSNVTTCSFPKLNKIGNLAISAAALTTLSLPELEYMVTSSANTITGMTALTTISIPKLISTIGGSFTNSTTTNITDITQFGTIGVTKLLANVTISNCKLTQQSVDHILALLVSLDGTNGTTLWGAGKTLTISGGTNAAPTFTGTTLSGLNGNQFVGVGISPTVVTVTINNHGFETNDLITTSGLTPSTYNGSWVITKLTDNTFSYSIQTATATTGSGTVTLKRSAANSTESYANVQRLQSRLATVATN